MRQNKRRQTSYGTQGLFSGLLFCSDCGSKLYYNINKAQPRPVYSYTCSTYRKKLRQCTAHYINEEILTQLIIEEMRELLIFVRQYEGQFVQLVMDRSFLESNLEINSKKKELEKHRKRIQRLDTVFEELYMDKATGKVSNERFTKLSASFETEYKSLNDAIAALEYELAEQERRSIDVDRFLSVVRKYTEITELTPAILNEFIDRIIIYEPEVARGNNRVQRVEIVYNNVGSFDLQLT